MAMRRILGREGGYLKLDHIRNKIVEKFKNQSIYDLSTVLGPTCPEYRLQYRKVDIEGAKKAISEKRPVVASYVINGF